MKWCWMLTLSAFVVLGAASVYMGGLNQDEGWYLYAANLVAEGRVPYRDFFFTQGPVLPYAYSFFSWIWRSYGLLGARLFTLLIGFFGVVLTALAANRLKKGAGFFAFVFLATNLYHLYYLTIPKTYALASLFVGLGFFLLLFEGVWPTFFAALALALAAGTRISLGALLPVIAGYLMWSNFRNLRWVAFGLGGAVGLVLVYGPFFFDESARQGLFAAQAYHAARGGFDPVWTIGSLSRLVRWYLPVLTVLAFGVTRIPAGLPRVMLIAFFTVFFVQIAAPFPYEDYHVPIMGLLAVVASLVYVSSNKRWGNFPLLVLCFGLSFGSPLLESWMTNGHDRFWSLKKTSTELSQLRRVAREINELDAGGKTLLTQDLYLAVETDRKVPEGLEMGPFAMLDDEAWRSMLSNAHTKFPIAALSGYTFAIDPPGCRERDLSTQLAYWQILEEFYEPVRREEDFGQHATPLLILKRK